MSRWDRLSSLLTLLDDPGATSRDGVLSAEAADSLAALVPCDTIAWFEFHGRTSTTTGYREWRDSLGLFDGPYSADAAAAFWKLFWASPFCTYDEQAGHRDAVVMQQDFHPNRRWRATPMYVDCLGQAPVEAEMILPLTAPNGLSRRLLFIRQIRKDFDEDDRLVLRLLRPHLNAALGRAARAQLTDRQLQVLRLAAVGATYEGIAHALNMSPNTARKHLENAYVRLGARGRSEAVTRAFPDGVQP